MTACKRQPPFIGCKGIVKEHELLSRHTTFRIGGPARFFIEPRDEEDLRYTVLQSRKNKLPVFLLGAGSNLLIHDKGIDGAVIRLSGEYFRKVDFSAASVWCGGGVFLARLLCRAQQRGFSGIEFLAGIPGSAAGALVMNAGAWGKNIADVVEKVRVMDYNGGIKNIPAGKIKFGYRHSSLARYIVLGAWLRLSKARVRDIGRVILQYRKRRMESQETAFPNAGCVFKNPSGLSAGYLLDACGLKGLRAGGAAVSLKHANFIVNRKDARASDIVKLMDIMKKKVEKKFGYVLEPEIKIWGTI